MVDVSGQKGVSDDYLFFLSLRTCWFLFETAAEHHSASSRVRVMIAMANRRFFSALTAVLGTALCLLLQSQVAWSASPLLDGSPHTALSNFNRRVTDFADFRVVPRKEQREAIMKEVERSRLEAKKRKKRIIAGVTGAIAGLALLVFLGAVIRSRWRKTHQPVILSDSEPPGEVLGGGGRRDRQPFTGQQSWEQQAGEEPGRQDDDGRAENGNEQEPENEDVNPGGTAT